MTQLPGSWTIVPLGQVAEINPPQPDHAVADDAQVSFVPMAAVEERTGRLDPSETRAWGDVRKGYKRFQERDVLFAKITPCMENGKVALAERLHGGVGAGSTEFHVVRPTGAILPRFVLHYLLQESIRRDARQVMQGAAGQLRVPESFLADLEIVLPPLHEQERIVSEIDAHFTRLDAAVSALERVRVNLKRYRASVLKAACEGRLVPTEAELARREGRDYEPADVLLERILKERRARWEAEELARLRAQGKEPKDDRWKRRYKEPQAPDTSGLPELPEGWVWASVNQLGRVHSGQTPIGIQDRCSSEGDVPFFRVGDMNHPENVREMNVADCWLTSDSIGALRLHVRQPGTIIFPKRGGAIATNKKRILSRPSCYDLNTMGITPAHEVAEYFWWWFSSIDLSALGDGSNVPQINHGDIEPLPVPLPPLAEQKRIADEVSKRISISEALNNTIDLAQRRSTRLRQSILKRAFEGRLVPQDPSDEPASVLLERIRAERGSRASAGQGARGRGATVPVPR